MKWFRQTEKTGNIWMIFDEGGKLDVIDGGVVKLLSFKVIAVILLNNY